MKVIDGIKKVQEHFPGVVLRSYLDEKSCQQMANAMHVIGMAMIEDRKDLIKAMDNVGVGIERGYIVLF
jgi:hypothetical protein